MKNPRNNESKIELGLKELLIPGYVLKHVPQAENLNDLGLLLLCGITQMYLYGFSTVAVYQMGKQWNYW